MTVEIMVGDCRDILPDFIPSNSIHCVVTSPPYFGLRDYGVDGQIGLEQTPDAFVAELVAVFREVRRVLRDDGTLWLNLGDSYAGSWGAQGHRITEGDNPSWHASQIKNHPKRASRIKQDGLKPKDLIGIPWMVAFALRADGWYLRQDIIWHKPNPMPESVQDRCTKAHEYVFMFSKSKRYFYDHEAVMEPAVRPDKGAWVDKAADKQRGHGRRHAGFNGRYAENIAANGPPEKRNRRSVWSISPKPFKEAHFATFPPDLVEPCILAGCPVGGTVLDPFGGAGTTGLVAKKHGRNALLIELNPAYADMARRRVA